jgi:hypothetical protein
MLLQYFWDLCNACENEFGSLICYGVLELKVFFMSDELWIINGSDMLWVAFNYCYAVF